MSSESVYDVLKRLLPAYAEQTKIYFSNGKNSIRIRTHNNTEFVFCYRSDANWSFETVDSFLDILTRKGR